MTRNSPTSSLSPRTIAKVILVGFIIRILSLIFAPASYRPIMSYAINIVIAALFAGYFLLVLCWKNINITIANIIMVILLAIVTILAMTAFLGDSSFIIASIGYGIWFNMTDWSSVYYVMALIFFSILLVMMVGVVKKLNFNYVALQLAAIVIIVGCLAVSLYKCFASPATDHFTIISLGDISMGVGYMGMALFIGAYGNTMKRNKEVKSIHDK